MIRDPQQFAARLAQFRHWTLQHALPLEAQVEAEDAVPEATVEQMRALGLFGLAIPTQFGGSGMTLEELCLSACELAYASMALRARYSGNTGIASEGLVQDGTEAQKARWLAPMAAGTVTGCMALTEPDAGSDAANVQTMAEPEGHGEDAAYVLTGTKTYVTNAIHADLFTVFARTAPGHKAEGVTAFLIPRDTAGLLVGAPYPKMGLRGSPVSDLRLERVRVPRTAILGGEPMLGKGFATALKALNKQRIHLSAMAVAQSRRLLDEALQWCTTRRQFGQPIAEFQMVQAMLAECQVEHLAARALMLDLARAYDRGEDLAMEASACKYFATEAVGRTADRVLQLFGGRGFLAEAGIERIYRDVRVLRLYEGTSQIHLAGIAKQMLKKARQSPPAAPAAPLPRATA
jgi:acyl-CoA dehydrogenase